MRNVFEPSRTYPVSREQLLDTMFPRSGERMKQILKTGGRRTNPSPDPSSTYDLLLDPTEKQQNEEALYLEKIRTETAARLEAFFGASVDIPPIPRGISREQIHAWERKGFKLGYLPALYVEKETSFPRWEIRLPSYFFEDKTTHLTADSKKLRQGWYFIEQTPARNLTYENHDLALTDAIMQLRDAEIIGSVRRGISKDHQDQGRRVCITALEQEDPRVFAAFAKELGVRVDQLTLPSFLEFNLIRNTYFTDMDTKPNEPYFEYFCDRLEDLPTQCISGGHVVHHEMQFGPLLKQGRVDTNTFRLMIRLP